MGPIPSRRWWRHPAVRWVAALVATRVVIILLFRSGRPGFRDAVRRANKSVVNPVMSHVAGRPHCYAALLEHVGRRSGRRYATPVVAQPTHGGFAIPLPYGAEVDWLLNLRAAGSGVLQVDGRSHRIRSPRLVTVDDLPDLRPWWRAMSQVYGIRQWLLVTAADEAWPTAPTDAAPLAS